ncbi:MAG TPA: class I tRNA ligase family protein, partial [Planctomycetota bacterium]|nr:class I tRNA ligase family protein [Planctomycetota bacterium]
PLHFGHIAGAYLPADIYVRTQRLRRGLGMEPRRGVDPGVIYICGTDEHGVAITVNAEREGQPYQAYVDHWYAEIKALFERFAISFDHFSRTTNQEPHYPLSQEFFLRLLRHGNLKKQDVQQLYSRKLGRFLADRYVRGRCYVCGHSPARGDECPKCGSWLDAARLVDPVNADDPADRLELRTAWQFELDMSPISGDVAGIERAYGRFFADYLGWIRARLKPNVRTMMFDKLIEGEGLKGRPITRDLPWGVPVPERDLDGASLGDVHDKVLYVWFDAPIGYISATIEWARDVARQPELWRRYWIAPAGDVGPPDAPRPAAREASYAQAAELVHFIGKDNIPFHGIVFPAMLAGQSEARPEDRLPDPARPAGRPLLGPGPGERYVLPDDVPANEFYNLEGRKFSTSDRWTVDPVAMADLFGVDALRWYLTVSMPETADSQFTFAGLKAEIDTLADVLGNYASRVLKFVAAHLGGAVPAAAPDWQAGAPYEQTRAAIAAALDEVGAAIGRCSFREAAQRTLALARFGNELFDSHAPWKLRKSDLAACGSSLHCHCQLVAAISVLIAPFMPGKCAELRAMLALPPVASWQADELPAGHRLGTPGILFAKIADEVIEAQRAA